VHSAANECVSGTQALCIDIRAQKADRHSASELGQAAGAAWTTGRARILPPIWHGSLLAAWPTVVLDLGELSPGSAMRRLLQGRACVLVQHAGGVVSDLASTVG
jgi:hypothetical protein